MIDEGICRGYAYQHRVWFVSVWGLLRNASSYDFQRFYRKKASTPIFQSQPVKCEGTNTVGDSKTLLGEGPGDESDSTIIGM